MNWIKMTDTNFPKNTEILLFIPLTENTAFYRVARYNVKKNGWYFSGDPQPWHPTHYALLEAPINEG